MEAIRFIASGKQAFFKNPETNGKDMSFSYDHIHKIAILGMLGRTLGLGGYTKRKLIIEAKKELDPDFDESTIPLEFYEQLHRLKVSIIPLAERGYFPRNIYSFNNSTGHASKENGGNLVVRYKILEDVAWEIYVKNDGIDKKLFEKLKDALLNNRIEFEPLYLGQKKFPATISDISIIELEKPDRISKISSLFIKHDVKLGLVKFEEKSPFLTSCTLPKALNLEYGHVFDTFWFTNHTVKEVCSFEPFYSYEGKVLHFH